MKLTDAQKQAVEAGERLIAVPAGYELKSAQNGKQNQNNVIVFRYEKANGENNGIGGEHVSFTLDADTHRLLGVTCMTADVMNGGHLPSKEQTREVAKRFLAQVEPGLFEQLENLWIDQHDEVIQVNGQPVTVSGMKYKCFLPSKNDYVWVIVGPSEQVITFEQGIIWQGGRVTEKWLHDSWLKETAPVK